MSQKSETPFENIEGALEYTSLLLDAAREAHEEVETEIARIKDSRLARRKEALQLASYKLVKLISHMTAARKVLNDLRMLRRLLLDERNGTRSPSAVKSTVHSAGA
jgi:hypothetical protein